jgi:hypothetical protein
MMPEGHISDSPFEGTRYLIPPSKGGIAVGPQGKESVASTLMHPKKNSVQEMKRLKNITPRRV